MDERTPTGQFAPGHPGGPGRPPKARELAYLAIAKEIVTLDSWRQIVIGAVEDATDAKDPIARNQARRFLAEYLIGKPPQSIRLRHDEDPFEEFEHLSDDQLAALAAASGEGEGDSGSEEAAES